MKALLDNIVSGIVEKKVKSRKQFFLRHPECIAPTLSVPSFSIDHRAASEALKEILNNDTR